MDPLPDAITAPEIQCQDGDSSFLEQRPGVMLVIFSLIYAIGHYCAATSTPMWADEIWTSYLAKAPDVGTIVKAINDGLEATPPLSFLLAHVSQGLFGATEVATRLPAMLGFWVMCITLFFFVKRRVGATCGYIAMLLPFFTYAASYSIEARAYGLVLGATGAALLFWQKAEEPKARWYALPAFAVSIAALVCLHYYALYVVAAIACAEALQEEKDRRLDVGFWIALLAGCSPLLYLLPIMKGLHSAAGQFACSPTPSKLTASYEDLIGPASVVVFVVILYVLQPSSGRPVDINPHSNQGGLRPREWFVAFLLLLMPAAAYMAALAITNAYMPKYVIPVVIGPAIIVPAFARRIGAVYPRLPAVAVWVLLGCFSLSQLYSVLIWKIAPTPAITIQHSQWTKTRTDLPLVMDSDLQFMQIAYYGTPAMQAQTYFLTDIELQIKRAGFQTGRTMNVGGRMAHLNVADFSTFVSQHRQFLFLRNSNNMLSWVSGELLDEGADLRLIQFEKQRGPSGDGISIFLVTMPPRPAPEAAAPNLKPVSP
jgi:hypothetical protein